MYRLLVLTFLSLSLAYPLYNAKGTYFEVGRQIGQAAKEEITFTLNKPHIKSVLLPFLQTDLGKKVFEGFYVNSATHFPHLIEEIHGLAKGSGFTPEEIFLLNALDEVEGYMGIVTDKAFPTEVHCTDVIVNSNTPCWGHNEDGSIANQHAVYFTNVTILDPTGKVVEMFTAFTYAGAVAGNAYGFNCHGLVFSENTVKADELDYFGVPGQITTRAAYGAQSVNEVITLLSTANSALGYNFNVGHPKTNRFVNVEVAPFGIIGVHEIPSLFNAPNYDLPKVTPGPYYYYHTNMYRLLATPCLLDPSSVHRMATLAKYQPPNITSHVRAMLGDTSDSQYPIYRNATSPDDPFMTYTTVVYDFVSMVANVYDQNPSSNLPYRQFPLWS